MASSTGVDGDIVKGFWVIKSDTILMLCLAGVLMKTRCVENAVTAAGERKRNDLSCFMPIIVCVYLMMRLRLSGVDRSGLYVDYSNNEALLQKNILYWSVEVDQLFCSE